ncbi:putative zinc transporter 8 [Wickerhamomyces ciferrii]|uniref:Zinc transporter 8 n=1 Tax=Wickerhamomyces ciferrii (strain ATCC 14091 / BCRC 22168 / CBS 111 / JCM 3599 / NBRC 0793 / NRRL Y-1031 F-60-10) TaxID=1206466 RepID=K0KSQ9_WICCF|nr:putative zinc transporter 8 [Wickerhamomyces ciferrii]CCH44363.1 putative zinc transporter 8 [Wickerhamomyces ciferrii]
MSAELLRLFIRDDADAEEAPECATDNEYDGRDNLRILAVFMILISSGIGTFFPLLSSRYSFIRLPEWCWFLAKFFGSGVIVATGFIHLLEPASDALGNECLGGVLGEYPWAFGICLMSLFALFLSEIIAHHFVAKAAGSAGVQSHSHFGNPHKEVDVESKDESYDDVKNQSQQTTKTASHVPGANHFSHDSEHQDPEIAGTLAANKDHEQYLNQVLSVFVLEFGIIFHSVFVGLSLAVAGDEFNTLFIVLVFHQMFEGLGLGTRIADTPWDKTRRHTPWLLALGFTITTPIAIAIGIGVRHSFKPESRTALISNGVFDAISAGILIYTGIVELMAHEFLYSNQFKGEGGLKKMLLAYFVMCWGAGLMALLGKWA